MKGITSVLLAVLAAAPAYGEDTLVLANEANGLTIITNQPCKQGGVVTKATNGGGVVMLSGCALSIAPDIAKVRWNDGQETYFRLSWGVETKVLGQRVIEAAAAGHPENLEGLFTPLPKVQSESVR